MTLLLALFACIALAARSRQLQGCQCNNVSVATREFDTTDLPPSLHPGVCATLALPNGKIAILAQHPSSFTLHVRLYNTDGSLFSSVPLDSTGNGQWAFSYCDFDDNLHYMDASQEGLYVLYGTYHSNFTGAALVRFNLDGSFDNATGYVRAGPLRDFNGDGQSYQQPRGAFVDGNAVYVTGFESVTAGTSGGYITKYLLPSLETDPTFGSIYIPSPNLCGGATSAGGALSFRPSRVLLGTKDCILSFNSITGAAGTFYHHPFVASGVPYSAYNNIWGFTSFTAPTRSFFTYSVDTNTSTSTVTAKEAFQLVGPAHCNSLIAQIHLEGLILDVQTSFSLLYKQNLTVALTAIVQPSSNWYFHSFVQLEGAFYIFRYRGTTLEAKVVQCL